MLIFCGTIFVAFSDSTLQSWNKIETDGNLEENLQLNPENHQCFKNTEHEKKHENSENAEIWDPELNQTKEQGTLKII